MINDQILIRGIIQTSLLFLIAYSAGSLVFYKGVKDSINSQNIKK